MYLLDKYLLDRYPLRHHTPKTYTPRGDEVSAKHRAIYVQGTYLIGGREMKAIIW